MLILSLGTKLIDVRLNSKSMNGIIKPIENKLDITNRSIKTLARKSGFE